MTNVLQNCGRLHDPLDKCWKCEELKMKILCGDKEVNPVNCPHGVAMDIYCKECEAKELIDDQMINKIIKRIWNEAIEAAALREAEVHGEGAAIRIRKLKK